MFRALLAAACLLASAMSAPSMPNQYNRLFAPMKIVGGEPATLGQFPHQVSFQINSGGWFHYCGGSIISETLVITAAHCLQSGVSLSNYRVIAGVLDHMDLTSGQVRGVAQQGYHEDFDMWFEIINDIGYLVLDEPLEFNDNVMPITVAGANDVPTSESRGCTASGWGNQNIGLPSEQFLNFVNIDLISDASCQSMWQGTAPVYPEQNICAGTAAGGESVCQGDSGGPLMCKVEGTETYKLFGATSWGSGWECGAVGYPAVWTEVPYFRDWFASEGHPLPE